MSEISLIKNMRKEPSENIISNYCGSILKMIYNESPSLFEEIINSFIDDSNYFININPLFNTQEKQVKNRNDSIPDVILKQESFNIAFEVKLFDWFYEDQLKKHLEGMNQVKDVDKKVLFLLGKNFENDNIQEEFKEAFNDAKIKNIGFFKITFEQFKDKINDEKSKLSNVLNDLIEELWDLFDSEGLLESWKYQLDIVNSKTSFDDFQKGFYICPNIDGPYKHRKSKYLGAYNDKKLSIIAEIKGVVVINKNSEKDTVKYKMDTKEEEEDLIKKARDIMETKFRDNYEYDEYLVFILNDETKTKIDGCEKISTGGMQCSKMYINVKNIETIEELSKKLNDVKWNCKSDLERIF